MPQYLSPGVFVEETSFRRKAIEGVSTSVTAFVGPTRRGPVGASVEAITSAMEFEKIYGGPNNLTVAPRTNYLAHAARTFFAEGGTRLHVVRVASGRKAAARVGLVTRKKSRFVARFPGEAGNGRIEVGLTKTPVTTNALQAAVDGAFVEILRPTTEFAVKIKGVWKDAADPRRAKDLSTVIEPMNLLTLSVRTVDQDGVAMEYAGLGLHKAHPGFIRTILSPNGNNPDDHRSRTFALELAATVTPLDLYLAIAAAARPIKFDLVGGTDGIPADWRPAFQAMAGLPDVSIIAAPGSTEFQADLAAHVRSQLIAQAETKQAYRVAVLDVPKGKSPAEALAFKTGIDSKSAALYYPWVIVANPGANPPAPAELTLPPSGFICGILARIDSERGVFKAPANEVVRSALRFERQLNQSDQETLNPAGVNCLRFFAGRGLRVWGARTTSSDPEWKYLNLRRYFIYLEQSIDRGTAWAVFEPNGETLWGQVRDAINNFLTTEWRQGALLGSKPAEAFFLKCDRTTMTQDDLDQGRLICLVGVAPIKPAEFVIFRVGQKTADAED